MKKSILFLVFASLISGCKLASSKSIVSNKCNEKVIYAKRKKMKDDIDKRVFSFYREFLSKYILTDKNPYVIGALKNKFSKSLLHRLHEWYIEEYDDSDGQGLALWLFRVGGQDPDNQDMLSSLKMEQLGHDWYKIKLRDKKKWGEYKVKIIKHNNSFVIDDLINNNILL